MRQTLISLAVIAAVAARADLPAITWTGELLNINSTTGAKSVVAQTNLSTTNAMAMSGGTLLVATGGKLYSVNRNTGVTNFLSTLTFANASDIRALASDPNGTLWAATNSSPSDKLWKVNISTGDGTLVGETGMLGIQAMDFDAIGQLWAWNVDPNQGVGLCRLHRRTGTGFDINQSVGNVSAMQTICFDASNNLYGANTSLYRIDQATGNIQLIGSNLGDVRGMEADNGFDNYGVPSVLTPRTGRIDAGNVDSVTESDGDLLRICKFIVPNRLAPPVVFDLTGQSPYDDLDFMSFSILSRVTLPGSFKIDMEAQNYVTGHLDLMKTVTVGLTMGFSSWTELSDPSAYVSNQGAVMSRLKVYPVGPQPANNWCYEMEQAYWNFQPFIR